LQVAAIARVLARRIGRVKPDEAMLAGLVHDIGIFYLLFRAAEYAEYRDNREAMLDLIRGWHESIGESLLHILGLPDHITEAVRDHDQPQNIEAPSSIRDILYFANLLAMDTQCSLLTEIPAETVEQTIGDRSRFADLLEEAEEDIRELRAALAV
jgi:HD-like signal output (HDOD) protein